MTQLGSLTGRVAARRHYRRVSSSHIAAADQPDASSRVDDTLADFLGWFGVGLGLAQILAPRGVSRLIGLRGDASEANTMRLFGLRELASGVGILAARRRSPWVWGRVAGDAMDLAFLGHGFSKEDACPERLAAATAAVVGVTALDVYNAIRLSSPEHTGDAVAHRPIIVRKSITIRRSPEDLYRHWRDFANLPKFMSHLQSVQVLGDGKSRWTASAPLGGTVQWDAETTEDRPNELIAWRSLEGSAVDTVGSVRFVRAPGDQGTEVHVDLHYEPPGGVLGAWAAWLFGEAPDEQLQDDLRLFKQVMETGEMVLSDSSLNGARIRQQPAQPRPEPVGAK